MTDHDHFDDELGAALRRRAGHATVSTASAHDAVLARATTIRRRRAAVSGAGATALLVLGGLVLLPRDDAGELRPADSGEVVPSIVDDSDTDSDTDSDDASSVPDDSTGRVGMPPDSSLPTPVGTTGDGDDPGPTGSTGIVPTPTDASPDTSTSASTSDAPSSSSAPSSSVAPSTSEATSDDDSTSSTPTTDETSTTEPSVLAPFTDTFTSDGGSITLAWSGTEFSLLAVAPLPGFTGEVEESTATRVRVRFHDDEDDFYEIDVRVEDGVLRVDID